MHPRWEDYNYERADAVHNRLYWLGDGQTYNEKTLTGDSEFERDHFIPEYALTHHIQGPGICAHPSLTYPPVSFGPL